MIDLAYIHFKCLLSTLDAFPEVSGEVDALVVKALAKACEKSNTEVELGPVKAGLMHIMYSMVPSLTHASKIKDWICQLHGQVKDNAHMSALHMDSRICQIVLDSVSTQKRRLGQKTTSL